MGNSSDGRPDPNAEFLGQQSSVGNNAGLDFALIRFVRWLFSRRRGR